MSSKSFRASAWPRVLVAGLLASCTSGSPPGGNVGTISLELVAHTADATYHLRLASFAIAGATATTLTTDGADSEATSLSAKLAVGHYTVTLADGWALYRGATAATEVRVAATLLSANPASFEVTSKGTTFVPFRFATDGLVIATGPTGTVEVSAEVNELHGLALLAGDPVQAGSTDGVGAAARFDTPTTLVADKLGNLYVNDSHNATIRKLVVATGEVTTVAGSPGEFGYTDGVGRAARFVFPYGMALDGKGNLYISDQFHLRRMVVATGEVIDLDITVAEMPGTRLSILGPLAVDGRGNPLVIEAAQSAMVPLRVVDVQAGTASVLAGISVPSSVDAMTAFQESGTDPAWQLLAIFFAEGALSRIAAVGITTDDAGVVAAGGIVSESPSFVGDSGNPGAADGIGSQARFLRPLAIANDGVQNLFVADSPNGTIRKVNAQHAVVTTVVGQAGMAGPTPGPLPAALGRPVGVAVLPNGALAISDGNAIYIARF